MVRRTEVQTASASDHVGHEVDGGVRQVRSQETLVADGEE